MTSTNHSKHFLAGFLLSLAGALLFSTKAILVKLAFKETGVDAVTLLSLRMLFALPFYLFAAWIVLRREHSKNLNKSDLLWIITMGICGYYLSSLFDFIGLQYVSAGLERLILFLYPTFAVLINTYIFKAALSKRQIIALFLTYFGIGIAYFAELKTDSDNPQFIFGAFMIFLCAITYSFYLVGTGKLVHKAGATRYTAYAMISATIGIFVHFLLTKKVADIQFTTTLTWYSIALAIIATVIPSFLMSNGMKKIGSNNVSIITGIGPVSTIIQAHFLLGEQILLLQILGTVFVVIGVVLIGWKPKNVTN
jgi:drug/metabolite transporter (DMT)-like permease